MTTPQAKLPLLLTNNSDFDHFLIAETLTQPGEEPSPIATFLHNVAEASPENPQPSLVFAIQLLEQAFDAGRMVGQMDIYVEVVQEETFGRRAHDVVKH